MNMHDERYRISITEDHETVEIRDLKTNAIHVFTGHKCLFEALGVLANWRERDKIREQ